jgi:uncharacterized membrane protein YgcG
VTGLQFCVYLGPTKEEPRALAERLFLTAEAEGHPAVLLVVAPDHRRVEILTAEWARERIPDVACETAIAHMKPMLQARRFDEALVEGIRHLAEVAGPGGAIGLELPDVFDET